MPHSPFEVILIFPCAETWMIRSRFFWVHTIVLTCCFLIAGNPDCHGQARLTSLAGEPLAVSDLMTTELTVVIFMSPECPLCENYSASLKQLRSVFSENEVSFVGVFSGSWYTSEEIIRFMARYQPPVTAVMDVDYILKHRFAASVTPEAVLIKAPGEIMYQGKIDNWIVSLGKKRTVVTEYYLRDAIKACLLGTRPEVSQTEPVGCFIE